MIKESVSKTDLEVKDVRNREECLGLNVLYRYVIGTDLDGEPFYNYVFRYQEVVNNETLVVRLSFQEIERNNFDVSRSVEGGEFADLGGINLFKYANILSKILKLIIDFYKTRTNDLVETLNFDFIHIGESYTLEHLKKIREYLSQFGDVLNLESIEPNKLIKIFVDRTKSDANLPEEFKKILFDIGRSGDSEHDLAISVTQKRKRHEVVKAVLARIFRNRQDVEMHVGHSVVDIAGVKENVPQRTIVTFKLS